MQTSDIRFKLGSVNPCGIADVYYIAKQDIVEWPKIVDDFDAAADENEYAVYKGDFVLANKKYWRHFYSTQGKGSISWDYEGETDCKVVVNKATLSYPKLTNQVRAFAKFAANGDFVFLIYHDGNWYVVGHEYYRATLTPNGASGDAPGSAKGVTVEITCPDTTPLPVYKGKILAERGTYDIDRGTWSDPEEPQTDTFTVTYDDNGADTGDVPTDTNSPYESGSTVTVLGNTGTLVKDGYTFAGWNTAADGSGTDYAAEDTFTIEADTVLYAKWTA